MRTRNNSSADASSAISEPQQTRGRGVRAPLAAYLRGAMLVPFLLVLASGCQTNRGLGESNTADLTHLRTAPEDWDRIYDSNDAAKLAALYAEDAILMPQNAPTVRGRRAVQADFDKFFAQNSVRHETFVDEILTHQDWAIERSRFTLTSTPKPSGPQLKDTGRQVVCRRKLNNSWVIVWVIWNTEAPRIK